MLGFLIALYPKNAPAAVAATVFANVFPVYGLFASLAAMIFIASVAFGMWQSWWVVFVITVAAMFAVSLNDQKKYTAQPR